MVSDFQYHSVQLCKVVFNENFPVGDDLKTGEEWNWFPFNHPLLVPFQIAQSAVVPEFGMETKLDKFG